MSSSIHLTLQALRQNRDFMRHTVAWERVPAKPAGYAPIPTKLDNRLVTGLQQLGIQQLYTHQTAATRAALRGENTIIATQTASGKSLCYTLPVLHVLAGDANARALYLFPTKALAQDQLAATRRLITAGQLGVEAAGYDGDTPRHKRREIRKNARLIISNPDMLHAGILPYHTQWRDFLANLRYVVVDEIHAYRGVFGSHVANVLRRLRRLGDFYGRQPQFIACSATIANPKEHAERLIERPFTLIDEAQNGAPQGERQVILYNPPLIDEELGLRRSAILTAKDAAATFLIQNVQTAVFARTRSTVELLLGYLQDEMRHRDEDPDAIAGYRGGYLPNERREIESGLRSGKVRGVVATNALELGVDIGELDAVVLTGYPGSIASLWQQAGRAGRRSGLSAALMIAGNSPLDQYIAQNPRYIFGRSPEHALINPDNLRIMVKHLACATFELPFQPTDEYGDFGPVDDVLEAMEEMGLLHRTTNQYHWLGDGDGEVPASKVSLRTSGSETVLIQSRNRGGYPAVIGEVDLESAIYMVYEGAIYAHQADTYLVEELDWDGRLAQVRPISVDYYTRATVNSDIHELTPTAEDAGEHIYRAHGEVLVITQATGYRKVKRYTHETLAYGQINLPEITLDTTGYWITFSEALTEQLYEAGILLRPNDYGPNWQTQRQKALARDGFECRTCGATQAETVLHVHHVRPFREYGYVPGRNDAYLDANQVDNLVTLCPRCHRAAEQGQQARSALGGLAYVWRNLAPLYLMCDPGDIQVTAEGRSPLTQTPLLAVYERTPAGVGLSERLYEVHDELLLAAAERVRTCGCTDGCPACVGPPGEIGPDTKRTTAELIRILRETG